LAPPSFPSWKFLFFSLYSSSSSSASYSTLVSNTFNKNLPYVSAGAKIC
jgi:hypothetical protein